MGSGGQNQFSHYEPTEREILEYRLKIHEECVSGRGKSMSIHTRRQGRIGSLETAEYHAVMVKKLRQRLAELPR